MSMTVTTISEGEAIRRVIRTPNDSQHDFRVLIDVLGRPGTVGRISVVDDVPAAVSVAAGLADVDIRLAVVADTDDPWTRAIYAATGAGRAVPADAQLVLAMRPLTAAEVLLLHRGNALNPELGSRLVMSVASLGGDGVAESPDAQDVTSVRLSGPGIVGETRLRVGGVPAAFFEALGIANERFPAGVDVFLVAGDGLVAGIPRSSGIRVSTDDQGEN